MESTFKKFATCIVAQILGLQSTQQVTHARVESSCAWGPDPSKATFLPKMVCSRPPHPAQVRRAQLELDSHGQRALTLNLTQALTFLHQAGTVQAIQSSDCSLEPRRVNQMYLEELTCIHARLPYEARLATFVAPMASLCKRFLRLEVDKTSIGMFMLQSVCL